jgi:hypothetical protein
MRRKPAKAAQANASPKLVPLPFGFFAARGGFYG